MVYKHTSINILFCYANAYLLLITIDIADESNQENGRKIELVHAMQTKWISQGIPILNVWKFFRHEAGGA